MYISHLTHTPYNFFNFQTIRTELSHFVTSLLGCGTTLFSIVPYCFFGSEVTYRLKSIGQSIYNSVWYEFPLQQQQLCRMMIQISQTNHNINGFGIVSCDLSTFLNVKSLSLGKCSKYIFFL